MFVDCHSLYCCLDWAAHSVQLGLCHLPAGVGVLVGLGTGGVQLDCQASRLGPLLACSGVQLGLRPSAMYLTLWMLLSGH